MQEEIDAIKRNGTWYLTKLPADAKEIGVKWILKLSVMRKKMLENIKHDWYALKAIFKVVDHTLSQRNLRTELVLSKKWKQRFDRLYK